MNSRYDGDNDFNDLRQADEPDREISLGTATIVGIFVALALLCAVFFGFGYSLGRHSAQPAASVAEAAPEADGGGAKPSPGSPAQQERSAAAHTSQESASEVTQEDTSADVRSQPTPIKTVVATPAPAAHTPSEARTVSAGKGPVVKLAPPPPIVAGGGGPVVQVAAVSHQEDADMLASALKRRGYTVSVRQTAQDKLLHVQVGPFASKKDADAMRTRLQADGYNAIVK
ncbi:MAG: SPOR domain-containing protein [Acidobacteriota bacterium]|nr:SPOR domain-containing protein [Acidobacteriota bacterium]